MMKTDNNGDIKLLSNKMILNKDSPRLAVVSAARMIRKGYIAKQGVFSAGPTDAELPGQQ